MTDALTLPELAHRCWRVLDTVHVPVYFVPETTREYGELGIKPRAGYFVSRSAAMGAVSPEVTIATFFVFAPGLVRHVMAGCWDTVTPADMLAARHRGVVEALRPVLAGHDDEIVEAAELGRALCEGLRPHGRPLYAAHAALPWPEDPLLGLWHAATLVREHRGDAHMAALLLAGVRPVEALFADAAVTGRWEFLSTTRGWTAEEWEAAEQRLRDRGLVSDDRTLTPAGTAWREQIEERTRAAAVPAFEEFGAQRSARLYDLVRPLAKAVATSGLLPALLQRK